MSTSPSLTLAEFASSLRFNDIPDSVVKRTQWLFLDWYASALCGSSAKSVCAIRRFAQDAGPDSGPCKILGTDLSSSAYFAAMVNGAASHVVEQDDLHNASIFHPATVVFPPIFALAQQDNTISGKDFLTAAIVGYETGIRVGEYLGAAHYKVFHMTATAGTVASAMACANLLKLDLNTTLHALGSAGTQAAGLWEFLKDAADSKQLHTAKASSDGMLAALTAKNGLTAASQILEGEKGMAAGMLSTQRPDVISGRLKERWGVIETSFKYHASCRHTHPAADALLTLCVKHDLSAGEIAKIDVFVYQAAKDVLGAVEVPETIHQSKFSMGFVLALIAIHRKAGVEEFSNDAIEDAAVSNLRSKTTMYVDEEIEAKYPVSWGSRVEVTLSNGEILAEFTESPKGDPDNMLSQQELEDKAYRLAEFSEVCGKDEMRDVIDVIWRLPEAPSFSKHTRKF